LWGRRIGFRVTVGGIRESRGEEVVFMNDVAATSLVSAASRRPAVRRISAARLIAVAVVALELAWVAALSVLLYVVVH
jgi:hypothetical protein